MKKLILCACVLVSTLTWAVQPERVVRAYMGQNGGYVLVDNNNEVIGMSDNKQATQVSQGMRNYLEMSGMELQVIHENLPQEIAMPLANDSFGPVLGGIEYNQSAPYYNHTPTVGEKHCVTGCVATAMAQIMAYWKYPISCTDTVLTYQTSSLGLIVTYDYGEKGTFDWDNMLDKYEGVASTEKEKDAVANLMFACGVSTDMNYTTSTSGSQSPKVPDALVKIFKYKKGLKFLERGKDLTVQEFSDAMRTEFMNGRPVYCSANNGQEGAAHAGHAFVIDGFKSTDKADYRKSYYHFNWGWGGYGNDWAKVTAIEYNNNMLVITGITPNTSTPVEEVEEDNVVRDNKLYDMMGREVSETIPGNLYIRNGEKFMAR